MTHLFVKSTYKYTVKKNPPKPKVKVHCFSSLTWNKRVYKYRALVWPVLFYKLASKWAVILHMRLNAPRGLVQTLSPRVHEIMCKWFFASTFVTSPEYLIECTWKISGQALKCSLLCKFRKFICNSNLNEWKGFLNIRQMQIWEI